MAREKGLEKMKERIWWASGLAVGVEEVQGDEDQSQQQCIVLKLDVVMVCPRTGGLYDSGRDDDLGRKDSGRRQF